MERGDDTAKVGRTLIDMLISNRSVLLERCALVPVKTVPNYFTFLCTCHSIFCHLLELVFITKIKKYR